MVIDSDDADPVELNISGETVWYIIGKAREYDVKVDPVEPDAESTPIDVEGQEILVDYPDDPTGAELREAIDDLNDDEVVDLIALTWVGRGDFEREEWEAARTLARERHHAHSAKYLMGIPTLCDYLEEGLAVLGHSPEPP